MALIAILTRDSELQSAFVQAAEPLLGEVVVSPCPASTRRLVRERPISSVVLDARCLPPRPDRAVAVVEGMGCLYPSVPGGVVASNRELHLLRALGSAGVRHLLLHEEVSPQIVRRFLVGLGSEAVSGRVVRALSPELGRWEVDVVRRALHRFHRQLDAEDFAAELGFARPYLSRRLRDRGLPSTGRLLRWAALLHAGHWMPDRGRTGESVGRQLEYANGSTFRRALRRELDMTPTELAEAGLPAVLEAFAEQSGFAAARLARVA